MTERAHGPARRRRSPRWRPITRVVTALALGLAMWTAHAQVAPGSALAVCDGQGDPATDVWFFQGDAYAVEESRESCNGNGVYLGKVFDVLTDQSCVFAQYNDGSFTGVQGVSCDEDGFNYSFWDQTGNTSTNYRVYVGYFTPPYLLNFGY